MKHRILLIEDNAELRENTAEILLLANYEIDTAENGKIGIEKALLHKPDLIICDIMMPVLDGYGVLHLLNKNESLSTIPLIFLTAKSERSDFRKGMEMGADDYITKPFTDIELLTAVESRIKKITSLKRSFPPGPEGIQQLISVFGGTAALEKMIAESDEDHYAKKQVLYTEGNHPHRLYYLKSGKVKCFIENESGKVLTTSLYGAGDFFGYTALLEELPYKETAETMDDSVIVAIPADEFKTLLSRNMEASRQFIQLLSKNVAEKEQQLLSIAYNSLRKRVAAALSALSKKYGEPGTSPFTLTFSREDLANIAGTATESLIRTLSDFKQEKLIDINGSTITILRGDALEHMLN
jgi:CRP-like cAMP-binding protein